MSGDSGDDDRRWWSSQNRLSGIWGPIAIAPFILGVTDIHDGHYLLGSGYVVIGLVLSLIVDRLMRRETASSREGATFRIGLQITGIVLILITWGLVGTELYMRYLQHDGATPAEPLAEDALKWRLANQIHGDLNSIADRSCAPAIYHYSTPYSEDLTNDVVAILQAAGCKPYDESGNDLPKSLTIWGGHFGLGSFEAVFLYKRFKPVKYLDTRYGLIDQRDPNMPPPFSTVCPEVTGCPMIITIGNQPESSLW